MIQYNFCLSLDRINSLLIEQEHSLAVDIYILLPAYCCT